MAIAATLSNNPPPDADPLRERLTIDHEPILSRADELLAAFERVPAEIDADTAGKASDYVKMIAATIKDLDRVRVAEKEPYLAGGRTVDGFFKAPVDKLEKAKRDVEARLQKHLRAVAEAERRRREEAERLAREEADRKRREAEEAAAQIATAKQLDDALAKEEAARQAAADAARAAQQADVKAADMARTRSDYGSLATLRTSWAFKDLDRDALDLEALRQHLPADALEKAVRSFIKAGGRQLRGCVIFEAETAVVR